MPPFFCQSSWRYGTWILAKWFKFSKYNLYIHIFWYKWNIKRPINSIQYQVLYLVEFVHFHLEKLEKKLICGTTYLCSTILFFVESPKDVSMDNGAAWMDMNRNWARNCKWKECINSSNSNSLQRVLYKYSFGVGQSSAEK